jgi:ornithine carbamoyltransferase
MTRHFLDIDILSTDTFQAILSDGHERKRALKSGAADKPLDGKVLALVFEQPSCAPASRSMWACGNWAARH